MLHGAKSKTRIKNPAEVLLHQDGVFEVTAPSGDVFHVTCHKGVRMVFTRVGELNRRTRNSTTWRIRRRPIEM